MSFESEELRAELLRRARLDQAVRRRLARKRPEPAVTLLELDADNTAWLKTVVEEVGWPGRSLVGEEAAHAAWLLAQHADRDPHLQRRCQELLAHAVAQGEATPADLAYLVDRVLVNSCQPQLYGTQLTAKNGRFAPQRLRDPDSVDARRASVGLEPLEHYLAGARERYGAPEPARIRCRRCDAGVPVWMPGPGETATAECPVCGRPITVRGYAPGNRVPAGSYKLSKADLADP
jgi:hypothetical protein